MPLALRRCLFTARLPALKLIIAVIMTPSEVFWPFGGGRGSVFLAPALVSRQRGPLPDLQDSSPYTAPAHRRVPTFSQPPPPLSAPTSPRPFPLSRAHTLPILPPGSCHFQTPPREPPSPNPAPRSSSAFRSGTRCARRWAGRRRRRDFLHFLGAANSDLGRSGTRCARQWAGRGGAAQARGFPALPGYCEL